ncbi:MAG TPA: hypothetical protein VF809_01105 [Candidatus Saccharimonadales bacterium]
MLKRVFYRNVRSRSQLELFLLAAITSLLSVRLYLHVTGYPQIGSGGLHIAHMLWGGVLMLGGLIISLSYMGARSRQLTAFIGGLGFGIFIDEIGKFITKDNNYFYQPAIGIIYAIFIILYLAFNFLSRARPLTSRECQLNALSQLEEAIVHDLDPAEKESAQTLLAQADQKDPITQKLQKLLAEMKTIRPTPPGRVERFVKRVNTQYEVFRYKRHSDLWLRCFFLAEAAIFVLGVAITTYGSFDSALDLFRGDLSYSKGLVWGQLLASIVAAGFAARGAILLPLRRLYAYEQFRRATMVNIFLTQFFVFSRIELAAMPGFLFNMVLLGLIGYAIRQEQQLHNLATDKKRTKA